MEETDTQNPEHLKLAYTELSGKLAHMAKLFGYYDGQQPLQYTNPELAEVFAKLSTKYVENWCEVVVNAAADRINLTGINAGDNVAANEALASISARLSLALDADELHTAAIIAGESFYVAWPDENGRASGYVHDPRLCHVIYDPANPKRRLFAVKWWVDGYGADARRRLNLYYPDRIEYYISKVASDKVNSHENFVPYAVDGVEYASHDHGVVPVFHFRLSTRKTKSDLDNAVPLQDASNKLLADLMVTSEVAAFPQRYAVTNADVSKLKAKAGGVWGIPAAAVGAGDERTTVGQFDTAPLTNYTQTIDHVVGSLSAITRTPYHYFFRSAGQVSGDALVSLEAPLVNRCNDHILRFKETWRELAAFLLKIEGVVVDAADIDPVFEDPQTQLPTMRAQLRQLSVSAGMPLSTVLRVDEGWSKQEIEAMRQDPQPADQLVLKRELGLTKTQALIELGYDKAEASRMATESEDDAAEAADKLLRDSERR